MMNITHPHRPYRQPDIIRGLPQLTNTHRRLLQVAHIQLQVLL